VHESGVAILLVEQNARLALRISSYGYILENGEIRVHNEAAALRNDPQVQEAYLGA
jgi:branched-chain amino acid transport system ATP-binding protein